MSCEILDKLSVAFLFRLSIYTFVETLGYDLVFLFVFLTQDYVIKIHIQSPIKFEDTSDKKIIRNHSLQPICCYYYFSGLNSLAVKSRFEIGSQCLNQY